MEVSEEFLDELKLRQETLTDDINAVRKEITQHFLEQRQAFLECFYKHEVTTRRTTLLNNTVLNSILLQPIANNLSQRRKERTSQSLVVEPTEQIKNDRITCAIPTNFMNSSYDPVRQRDFV